VVLSIIVIAPNKTVREEPQPAMEKITQNMRYRESLVKYAKSKGVSIASRKYNKSRSYIYFWLKRYDGRIESLAERSRRPHHHPKEHSVEEIRLIHNYWNKNQNLGLLEFWFKVRKAGYERHYVSLYRAMRREGLRKTGKKTKSVSKPYEQMSYPGQRVQIDVKHVPRECIQDKEWKSYYQYTAIDEYSRLRYLEGYQQANTFSSADFINKVIRWFSRKGIRVECVQTDNGQEFTAHYLKKEGNLSKNLFEQTLEEYGIRHKRIKPYTPRHNGKVERSHREDQKRFYDHARFYSFHDFRSQLRRHNQRSTIYR
jgi:hypothetical protein